MNKILRAGLPLLVATSAFSAEPVTNPSETALADSVPPPETIYAGYQATQAGESFSEEAMAPRSVMMSLPASVANLQLATRAVTNGVIGLEIGWPASFTNELEVFATTDLAGHMWQVVCTDIMPASTGNYLWIDWASTNMPTRFYIASKSNLDSDGDGLADGREIYVYGSKPDDRDSDDDGLDDDVELEASPSTDPLNSDKQAPLVFIESPVNDIVVVP